MIGLIKGIGKKVVIMKNTECDYIEEAIFILKNNNNISKTELIDECEKIINRFKPQKQKTSKIKIILIAILLVQIIATVTLIFVL